MSAPGGPIIQTKMRKRTEKYIKKRGDRKQRKERNIKHMNEILMSLIDTDDVISRLISHGRIEFDTKIPFSIISDSYYKKHIKWSDVINRSLSFLDKKHPLYGSKIVFDKIDSDGIVKVFKKRIPTCVVQ